MKNITHFAKPFSRARSYGFTLTELMIVITIIAILAAITIPAVKGIIDRAQRTAAKNDAQQLKTAIAAYYTEYRRYPTRIEGPEDAARPVLSDHALMDILLAAEHEATPKGMNPRGTVFFSSSKNARPMGNGKYRSGVLLEENGGGTLWDPWGNHYRILMDLDGNERIPAPPSVTSGSMLPGGVIIWSAGADGKDETGEDNVETW